MNLNYIIKSLIFIFFALIASQRLQAADKMETNDKKLGAQRVSIFSQLDQLRSENAVLTEALKNAELKSKINNDQHKKTNANLGFTPNPMTMPGNYMQGSSTLPTAQVQMVSGTKNNLTALISLPNGGIVNAKVNTNISGVGTVKSITLNEVIVMDKSQKTSLPFAADSTKSAATNRSGMSSMSSGMPMSNMMSMPQMPALPPLPPAPPGGL